MIKLLSWLLALIVTGSVIAYFVTQRTPPRTVTLTRMSTLRQEILRYAREEGSLPPALSALPAAAGHETMLLDGWKRPIGYRVDPGEMVSLTSLGADGIFGGEHDDQDMFGRFATRTPQGYWIQDAGAWLQYPLDPAIERFEDLSARAVAMGETSLGKTYEEQFSTSAMESIRSALAACSASSLPPFSIDLVVEMAMTGRPLRIIPAPNDSLSICVAARLHDLQLPVPPQEGWLVHVSVKVTP